MQSTQAPSSALCAFEPCDRAALSSGLCTEHHRARREGRTLAALKPRVHGRSGCLFEGCDRSHKARGYCSTHYTQILKGNVLSPIRGWTGYDNRNCVYPGCGSRAFVRDLCVEHKTLRQNHAISSEQIVALFSGPMVCSICGENPGDRRLSIDHDHTCCPGTGSCGRCIRGLLCRKCNLGIGNLRDDESILLRAIAYLRAYEGSKK